MLRVISYTVISLLLVASANAQMSGRLDSLRAYTLDQANVSASYTSTVSQVRVTRAINAACAMVARDFPAIEKLDTIYLVDSVNGVALNSDFSRVRTAYQWYSDSTAAVASYIVPMMPVEPDSIPGLDPTKDENIVDPTDPTAIRHYWTFGNRFFTQPAWGTTDDSLKIIVSYYADANYLNAVSDTTLIQPEYRPYIVTYAVVLLKRLQGLFAEAAEYEKAYYVGVRGQGAK